MARLTFLSLILLALPLISIEAQETDGQKFVPKLGVCTSITNHEIVADAGFDYIEESVGRFLIPNKSEEEFQKNLEIFDKFRKIIQIDRHYIS